MWKIARAKRFGIPADIRGDAEPLSTQSTKQRQPCSHGPKCTSQVKVLGRAQLFLHLRRTQQLLQFLVDRIMRDHHAVAVVRSAYSPGGRELPRKLACFDGNAALG